jgi:hypothetical protein
MYSTFSNINDSFKLAWKHKILWILALLLVGGMNFNSFSNASNFKGNDSKKEDPRFNNFQIENPQGVVDKITSAESGSSVLAAASVSGEVENKIPELFQGIPSINFLGILSSLVMLVPIILLVALFWCAVSFLINVWAKGAYYSGLIKASNSEPYEFKDLGSEGKRNWKRYLKLSIYFFYKRLLSVLPVFGIGLILAAVNGAGTQSNAVNVIFGILMFAAILWAFVYNIRLYFVEQFALRSIIADNVPTKATFKLGWKYYKTRPGKSIKLALALILVLPICMIVAFLPTGILAGITAFLVQQEVSFVLIGFVGLLAAITGGVTIAASAPFINNVASFSWTRLFLFIRESFDDKPAADPVEFMYKPEAANGQI